MNYNNFPIQEKWIRVKSLLQKWIHEKCYKQIYQKGNLYNAIFKNVKNEYEKNIIKQI